MLQLPLQGVPPLIEESLGAGRIRKLWNSCRRVCQVWENDPDHPKHGQYPNRDDAFSQLIFGSWQQLLGPTDFKSKDPNGFRKAAAARQLWKEALRYAFPETAQGKANDRHRVKLLLGIDRIRRLRNRVSHGENVLRIQTGQYLDKMLVALSAIGHRISGWGMDQTGCTYRTAAKLKHCPMLLQACQQNDPLSSDRGIVAYKLTSSGSYSGKEVIEAHLKNAQSGEGRTLMTLGKPTLAENKPFLKEFLLIDAEGKKAAVGETPTTAMGDNARPPEGYALPACQKPHQKRKAWFAVKNLYEVDCRDGRVIGYKTTDGQKAPDCFTGQATMRYVCHA